MSQQDLRTTTLEWIPRSMRTRMDLIGARISLAQWQALDLGERHALAQAAQDEHVESTQFAALLALALGTGSTARGASNE